MGTQPFSSLPAVLAKRKAEIVRLVNQCAQGVATAASNEITAETPVKTGAARSNWVASLDVPFESVIPPYSPYPDLDHSPAPPERKFETANLEAARNQNRAVFGAFNAAKNKTIYLRNNAEHIGLLNDGRSQQSAAGWFERAVAQAAKAMQGRWKLAP